MQSDCIFCTKCANRNHASELASSHPIQLSMCYLQFSVFQSCIFMVLLPRTHSFSLVWFVSNAHDDLMSGCLIRVVASSSTPCSTSNAASDSAAADLSSFVKFVLDHESSSNAANAIANLSAVLDAYRNKKQQQPQQVQDVKVRLVCAERCALARSLTSIVVHTTRRLNLQLLKLTVPCIDLFFNLSSLVHEMRFL